jgi:multiple sugar transport system permease protein
MRIRSSEPAVAAAMVGPSVIGILLFLVAPIGVVVWLTTQRWDLIAPPEFVGLRNVSTVLADGRFWNSVLVTLGLVVVVVPVQAAIGFAIALLLRHVGRSASVWRTVLVLPWVAAPLALGVVWRWVFAPTGGLVSGILGHRVEWIVDPIGAPIIVAFVLVWSNVGFVSLFFSAGLLAIPPVYDQAARLDGANRRQLLRHVTIPLLRPTILFVLITSTVQVATTFDHVFALTGGGPDGRTDVLAMRIYSEAFVSFDLGPAAVMALGLFLVLGVLTLLQRGIVTGPGRAR